MRRLKWLPFLCLALTSSAWPQNDERILRYHSDITVNSDGSMDVRETIQVRARGQQIKRGIYRDFPTTYQDRFGQLQRVDFQLRDVLRDGQPDGSRIVDQGNSVRVYVGKADVFLPPGEYTYVIRYRTTRQISYFQDHDELYWNVTGNGWGFFIDSASANVTLPPGILRVDIRLEGYTGPSGAKGRNFASRVQSDGKSMFYATQALAPHEGLTIVVSFPKGFVTLPAPPPAAAAPPTPALTESESAQAVAHDVELVGLVGLLVVALYYLLIWSQVGRDPEGGAIMPRYEPLESFSPAAMRYLTRMGFDHKTFTAAVLNMAVKGHLTIQQSGAKYTIARKAEGTKGLAPDETVVSTNLLGNSGTIELQDSNHAVISGALTAQEDWLKKSQRKIYFFNNRPYLIPGVLLSLIALFAMLVSLDTGDALPIAIFMTIILVAVTAVVFFQARQAVLLWRAHFGGGGGRLGAAISRSVFVLLTLAAALFGLWLFSKPPSTPIAAGLLAALVGCNVLFYYLLNAPTRLGRRTLDQIEGFKMFLTAVEGDRLRMQGAVEKTPALFEKYLPYAVALDVEHQWAEKFSEAFARAAAAGDARDAGFSLNLYSTSDGESPFATSFVSSVSSFGDSFSRAVASSSTAPSTSDSSSSSDWGRDSGSDGGGSSGGGGGGGGGGGW